MPNRPRDLVPVTLAAILLNSPVLAGSNDDPWLTMLNIDRLESPVGTFGEAIAMEADLWSGRDLQKLWLKTRAQWSTDDGDELELQALYRWAYSPFWEVAAGLRTDSVAGTDRHWTVFTLHGQAPYFIDVDASLFVGEHWQTGLRLELEYELLLSQQWRLSPEFEVNAYSKNQPEQDIGRGVADIGMGLRLHYQVNRQLSPYLSVDWQKNLGRTASMLRAQGRDDEDSEILLGISWWL